MNTNNTKAIWAYLFIGSAFYLTFFKKRSFNPNNLDKELDRAFDKLEKIKTQKSVKQIDGNKAFIVHKIIISEDKKEKLKKESTSLRKLKWLLKDYDEWEITNNFKYKDTIELFIYPTNEDQPLRYLIELKELKKLGIDVDDFSDFLMRKGL